MKTFTLILVLFLIVSMSNSATIRVPEDQPTIQAGIDASVDGDTVLVNDGTYTGTGNVNLDFKGKPITVKSLHGATATTIDCLNVEDTKGFIFQSGETSTSVLDGFTITNGNANVPAKGGGIYCFKSSPNITNCVITGNTSSNVGGGIYCFRSSTNITNCTITNNRAHGGAGLLSETDSFPVITNCVIAGNTASVKGGGIYCFDSSSATITVSSRTMLPVGKAEESLLEWTLNSQSEIQYYGGIPQIVVGMRFT